MSSKAYPKAALHHNWLRHPMVPYRAAYAVAVRSLPVAVWTQYGSFF